MSQVIEISRPEVMAEEPLVSVLMLAYRHEAYIAQAIESVLAQECDFPFELIIAEDCSPDHTRPIAEGYVARHPAVVRIVTGEANVGMMPNFFRALEKCRGKYIAFCEGDDYWNDEAKLRKQVTEIEKNQPADLIVSAGHERLPNGEMHSFQPFGTERRLVSARQLFGKATRTNSGMTWLTAGLLIKKSKLLDLPLHLLKNAPIGDIFIVMAGVSRHPAIYSPSEVCVYRMLVPGSWTSGRRTDWSREDYVTYAQKISHLMSKSAEVVGLDRRAISLRTSPFDWLLFKNHLQNGEFMKAAARLVNVNISYIIGIAKKRMVRSLSLVRSHRSPSTTIDVEK